LGERLLSDSSTDKGSDNTSSNGNTDNRCTDSGSDYTSSNGNTDKRCADRGRSDVQREHVQLDVDSMQSNANFFKG
jgi:hypothetical protein